MFAGKKSAQIREILISESAWEEMTCLFAPSLGVPDNVKPDDKGVTWNNTHTATLEDYKINEKTDPLYTKDAEEAEYKAELKNK